jgi:ribosomal protein L15
VKERHEQSLDEEESPDEHLAERRKQSRKLGARNDSGGGKTSGIGHAG